MAKRKNKNPAPAAPSAKPILRTVFAPDGAKLEFAPSDLWQAFDAHCDRLKAKGIPVPAEIIAWHARYASVVRVNGSDWEPVDLGPEVLDA